MRSLAFSPGRAWRRSVAHTGPSQRNCIPTKGGRRISRPAAMRPKTCCFAAIAEVVHHSKIRCSTSALGHFRPGRGQQYGGHVGCAPKSGSNITVLAS
jgi:hypothetical protein